jgi:diguanylate cyclase (GGDEF)-like protein
MHYKFSKKILHLGHKQLVAGGIALLILISFIWVFETLIQAQSKKIESDIRLEAISYGSSLRYRVSRELNSLLFISNGLASYLNVYHKDLKSDKINAILKDLYSRSQHVRNLAVAIDYKITYVYPVAGNEKIIGLDYRSLPEQWPQIKQAAETKSGVLAGPLTLVQGGSGLIYRYPVFIDDQYWGIVSTVINTDPFLKAAFNDTPSKDYEFAVRAKTSASKPKQAFYGDNSLFTNPSAFLMESEVPNGEWEWAIHRKTTSSSIYFISLMRLMELVATILLAGTIYLFLHERAKLSREAMYDSLTGLANRRLINDRMNRELAQADRSNKLMAMMFVDLDDFKEVNDKYGHDFGDQLLKTVARKLMQCVRVVDTVGRLGGDEFVVVLAGFNQPEDASVAVENVMKTFDHLILVDGRDFKVSLSVGVAIYTPRSNENTNDLMKKADKALYEAKDAGKNCYRVYT